MVALYFFIMITVGFYGFIRFLRLRSKLKFIDDAVNLMKTNSQLDSPLDLNGPSSQLDRTFMKNNKVFSFVTSFDSNIKLKLILSLWVGIVIAIMQKFNVFHVDDDVVFIVYLAVVSFVIIAPSRVQALITKKRIAKISKDIPFLIELLSICTQSGMTVEASLGYIAKKIDFINKDLSLLLSRTILRAEVSGINSALQQLSSESSGNEEVCMLCAALQQSTKFGTSIYSVLIDLAKDIRNKQFLEMEEKVASLSAKMTMPMILFILFPLIAIIAGPGIISMGSL